MCRLVDCFENSLVEGRIYRYTLSPKAAAIFPLPPAWAGEGAAHTMPDPTPSAPRPAAGTLCPAAGGYWVCIAIHRVCSDMHIDYQILGEV